jgi:hypothetical protein
VNNKLTCGAPLRHGGESKPLQCTPPQLPRAVALDELISRRGRQRRRAQQPRAPGFQVLLAVVVAASTERQAPMKRRPSAAAVIVVCRRRPLVKEHLDLYVRRASAEGQALSDAAASMSTFDTNCMTEGLLPADDHIIEAPEDDEHDGLGCSRAGSSSAIEQGLDDFGEEENRYKSLPNAMCVECRWTSGNLTCGLRDVLARSSVGWLVW